jgi:hypothetical protein
MYSLTMSQICAVHSWFICQSLWFSWLTSTVSERLFCVPPSGALAYISSQDTGRHTGSWIFITQTFYGMLLRVELPIRLQDRQKIFCYIFRAPHDQTVLTQLVLALYTYFDQSNVVAGHQKWSGRLLSVACQILGVIFASLNNNCSAHDRRWDLKLVC